MPVRARSPHSMKPRKWLAGPESYKLPSLSLLFISSRSACWQAGSAKHISYCCALTRFPHFVVKASRDCRIIMYWPLAVVARLLPQVVDTGVMLQYELRPAQQRLRRSPRLTQLLIVRIRRPSVALLGEGFLSITGKGGREARGGNEIDRVTERVLFHLTLMATGPRPPHRPTDRPKKQATDLPFLPSFAPALLSAAPTSIRCR